MGDGAELLPHAVDAAQADGLGGGGWAVALRSCVTLTFHVTVTV